MCQFQAILIRPVKQWGQETNSYILTKSELKLVNRRCKPIAIYKKYSKSRQLLLLKQLGQTFHQSKQPIIRQIVIWIITDLVVMPMKNGPQEPRPHWKLIYQCPSFWFNPLKSFQEKKLKWIKKMIHLKRIMLWWCRKVLEIMIRNIWGIKFRLQCN